MTHCKTYDPDNVFRRFQLLEFPISFVGLSTMQELDVSMDITGTSYLKTLCKGTIMDFEEAREISPSHRSYNIKVRDYHTLEITFAPTNECIAKAKLDKETDLANRFIFDLRVINVEGKICCNDERHAEVGRYYICGQYEYCNITHSPKIVDFGKVAVKGKVMRTIRIRNESKLISTKISYSKVTGFDVTPRKFCIPPNSSKKIEITINPNSLKIINYLDFHVRNPHDSAMEPTKTGAELPDENYLPYKICVQATVFINVEKKVPIVESLHTLHESNPKNTFLKNELHIHNKRKLLANQFLQFSKSHKKIIVTDEKHSSKKPGCYSELPKLENVLKTGRFFCKEFRPKIGAPDLFSIVTNPQSLDFGRVGVKTYGEKSLTIKNNSKFDITIKFISDKNVLYTKRKLREYTLKMKSQTVVTIVILCFGFLSGNHEDIFKYVIDNRFHREYEYKVQIGNPLLTIATRNLKFGMATGEGFVSSVPVKIHNYFNIPIDFEWAEINSEVPFDILPGTGTVPAHGCNICDMTYISKLTKTKSFTIECISKGIITKTISIEANIVSRKLSVRFLQQILLFKDIPLNMEVTETVRLENSSKEIAVFYILEPLLPGMTVEPMNGVMRPKSIITFNITLKISCILEFYYDLYVRVNNKENIALPISGNVMEPKLIMTPRNVFMPRVPCGMVTYVPITVQNSGNIQSLLEILETGDENIFDVYIQDGYDKRKINRLIIKAGQTKTLFIKVCDVFRREYDMYIPFKVNGLLGPPILNQSSSTEVGYYVGEYEKCSLVEYNTLLVLLGLREARYSLVEVFQIQHLDFQHLNFQHLRLYENNPKIKVKSIHKDINYTRIIGVFTVPWIELSVDKFEIEYVPNDTNVIEFTMTNISKYYLHVCILTSKLYPHFSLDIKTEDNESIINETFIKFELDRGRTADFTVSFTPQGLGTFSQVATLYLDKAMSLPFHNLLFVGRRQFPAMRASTHRIIFPPSYVGIELFQTMTVTLDMKSELSCFTCSSKEESNISVELIDCRVEQVKDEYETIITVKITVCCKTTYARNLSLVFVHDCGSTCCVEVCFCFTYCPITLHANQLVTAEENPYPFYPLSTQVELYEYMENCTYFLERWIFQQGFRRDLFPIIPDTFHALAPCMVQVGNIKIKGINISLLNFMRRIAGPLMKHIHKASCSFEEPFKTIAEIHDTYKSIVNLLRSRGAYLWLLQAKFLLTHTQFKIYSDNLPPVYEADIVFTEKLVQDPVLYNRLTKQCWFDLLLQCYKVFIFDSCFFDCVCVSSEPRDINMILTHWYNEQLTIAHHKILKDTPIKYITNITTDLRDGIAIISALYNHCPFLEEYFNFVREVDENDPVGGIVHNACIIMETMNLLKLNFPITSKDFLKPIFLQMLFFSIHLYVILPMFRSKSIVELNPPLLRTSSRTVSINPTSQESLIFSFVILNNNKNSFSVEKIPMENNVKKTSIYVKYTANFVSQDKAILLIHGYNKTRIFDTYMTFTLVGNIGALNPVRKCKLTAPIYRPNKVDITVHSPFLSNALFQLYVTDTEPTIPMVFEERLKKGFHFNRLSLIDNEITLTAAPVEQNDTVIEHKVYLHLFCLNTQTESSWIWFRSDIGEFFLKVCTQPRWDLVLDTYLIKVQNWPIDPCSCGEACECYRSAVIMLPHRNDLMLKALRFAMAEFTTGIMMNIYDQLIESTTGQVVLMMLLNEGGTKMSEVAHILRPENTYRISSRYLIPRVDRVTMRQYTDEVFTLPITLPLKEKSEKFTIMLTSDCGMDIRTYKILFIEDTGERISSSITSTTVSSTILSDIT